jgi:hypothetical protein
VSFARPHLLLLAVCLPALAVAGLWLRGRNSPQASTSSRAPVEQQAPASVQADLRRPQLAARPAQPEPSAVRSLASLAADSDDPAVVEAAFSSILSTHAARSTKKPGSDAELERAIAKHVKSARASTALAALGAARVPLMSAEPSELVTNAIVEVASPDQPPARRYAGLDALNLIRPSRRSENVLAAFESALDAAEPELVSFALLALSQSRASLETAQKALRSRLAARVLELLGHADPGVRGHALLVLAEVPALVPAEARAALGRTATTDSAAFVRARAADLLARCGDPSAMHALIGLVADLAPARYELRGFTRLDGSAGVLVHELPGRKHVAEAALFALVTLSERVDGTRPLALTLPERTAAPAELLQSAEIARAWYRSSQQRIPSAPR